MIRRLALAAALLAALVSAPAAHADPMLADFDYPFPVQRFDFKSQGQDLSMAYMDVQPEKPNGRAVVLLHGKNFCGATWEGVMRPLLQAGYRVIAPDQVGFCKSTKPQAYQFGLHQLAANTKALLDSLGIQRPVVMGHSMGGMLAMRYALAFPDALSGLVLVNPIGLEDWKAAGVPQQIVDQWFEGELKTSADSIKAYQQATYYAGEWRPDYDRWVDMLAGMYRGEGGRQVAWDQALTSDMVFNQPVVYELERIRAPTVLMIGERDTTAIGKALAPPEIAQRLGNYAELSRAAAKRIPGANLIRFPGEGHAPQIQSPEQFNKALLGALGRFPPP
jgi:pimeloyl-ACP methyl ester carboxylesterase